jgi:hypothetical protein
MYVVLAGATEHPGQATPSLQEVSVGSATERIHSGGAVDSGASPPPVHDIVGGTIDYLIALVVCRRLWSRVLMTFGRLRMSCAAPSVSL